MSNYCHKNECAKIILSNLFEIKFEGKLPEATTRGVLQKKVFLKISQNLQENTCARVSFLML